VTLQATLTAVNDFIKQSRSTEAGQGGVYYQMLRVWYSNGDKPKFEKLNDALS
jgi:hypothetical protein